jgi:hypothetical protein
VRFNDFVNIRGGDPAVPDSVGIHDHGRAVLALIEAPGLIRSDAVLESKHSQLLLESELQLLLGCGIAAAARMALRSLVAADKDMSFKLRHKFNLQ